MPKNNDLVDFMTAQTNEIQFEYNRIQKRSSEDAGTAGDQGEENWAKIMKDWLPADYQVVTKGRLINPNGEASPQVDIIVLYPYYPSYLLNKKLYLTAGVAAVFECKNTLKNNHIEKTIENSTIIKRLNPLPQSTFKKELYSPIVYGLLAHSHSWKSPGSQPLENIYNQLQSSDLKNVEHPRECLDFICVSDLAMWESYKQPMQDIHFQKSGKHYYDYIPGVYSGYGQTDAHLFSGETHFTPLGSFLSSLMRRLALTDERLKHFSNYFSQTIGGGSSIKWRSWSENILSKEARNDLKERESYYRNLYFDVNKIE
ncbi:MAG: hypothetical protein ACI9YH_003235 [Colwellia sp.]|jgi:hypothetical protein